MSPENNKNSKPSTKAPRQSTKKDDTAELMLRMDQMMEKYEQLHNDLDLCVKVNRILIELLGGVAPGRKNLDCVQIARLRMEGVKVKDLARMQGISEAAMHRQLKQLREEGLLSVPV